MEQSFEQFFETGLKFVTLNNLLRRISVLQKNGDNIKMEREMNELEDLLVNILTTCSYCAQSQFEKRCPPCQALEDVLQGIADQYSNKGEKSDCREKKRLRVSESSESSESSENEEPLEFSESSESFETGESDESYKDESDSEVNLSSKEEVAEELEEDVDVEEEEDVRRIKKKKRVRYVEEEEEDSSDIPVLPNRFEYRGDSVVHEGIEYPWVKAHMVRGVYKRPRREKRVRH